MNEHFGVEKVREYKGVAYFKNRKDAEAHMKRFAPKGRVVEYERGYAVQTRISGPYLNKSGKTDEVEERIKKLIELSGISVRGYYDETGSTPLELQKFTELIVRECAGINLKSPFQDGEFHAREVLEHFGVDDD